jgi:hypothetical protein
MNVAIRNIKYQHTAIYVPEKPTITSDEFWVKLGRRYSAWGSP